MLCKLAFIGAMSGVALASPPSFEDWLSVQEDLTSTRLFDNVSPADSRPGAIVAATSRQSPNYFSHWVRDGGLVMFELNRKYEDASASEKPAILKKLVDHMDFSQHIQGLANRAGEAYGRGLGEVRFNPDGTPFDADWGRPQADGPALRAVSMIQLYDIIAQSALPQDEKVALQIRLYSGDIMARSVIKSDLEYVAHHWHEPCVDLWEELNGRHFYTMMSMRAAMKQGAAFARLRNDHAAADFYAGVKNQIDQELNRHWIAEKQLIAPTIDYRGGLSGKTADLDVSILLAVLHVADEGDSFDILDSRVIKSATSHLKKMNELYTINRRRFDFDDAILAPAIGRYPEDVYDGNGFSGGHPWFLATLAYAEWTSKIARRAQLQEIRMSAELVEFMEFFGFDVAEGDVINSEEQAMLIEIASRFFRRVRLHSDPRSVNDPDFSGRMSEQFDRDNGGMRGAENLTWSYAAFGSAYRIYSDALQGL